MYLQIFILSILILIFIFKIYKYNLDNFENNDDISNLNTTQKFQLKNLENILGILKNIKVNNSSREASSSSIQSRGLKIPYESSDHICFGKSETGCNDICTWDTDKCIDKITSVQDSRQTYSDSDNIDNIKLPSGETIHYNNEELQIYFS